MPVIKIPDDWDGVTWGCYLIEWPQSVQWNGLLRGLITTPTRGRFWDERSGIIKDAQAIGKLIEERNDITMACQDIVNQLSIIAEAIAAVDLSVNNQTVVSQKLVNAVSAQANSFASAQSWSNAISASYANATLINEIRIDIRNFGEMYPPITEQEAADAGLTTTPTSESEACRAAYWIVRSALELSRWMTEKYDDFWFSSTEALLGFVAWALRLGADTSGVKGLQQLPPGALTALVEALQYIDSNFVIAVVLADFHNFLDTRFDDVVCEIFNAWQNAETALAASGIAALAIAEGLPPIITVLINAVFNTNTISHAFLVPSVLLIPDVPEGYVCCPGPGV